MPAERPQDLDRNLRPKDVADAAPVKARQAPSLSENILR